VCGEVLREKSSPSDGEIRTVGKRIEDRFLSHLNLSRESTCYQKKLVNFWNQNQNKFICKASIHYGRKHLFKVVADLQMYNPVLLEYFLKEGQKYKRNVNAYEMKKGKRETTLDYLYDIETGKNSFLNYNIPEINELIEILEDEYGALRGRELKL
jgi:hypothetical protein